MGLHPCKRTRGSERAWLFRVFAARGIVGYFILEVASHPGKAKNHPYSEAGLPVQSLGFPSCLKDEILRKTKAILCGRPYGLPMGSGRIESKPDPEAPNPRTCLVLLLGM